MTEKEFDSAFPLISRGAVNSSQVFTPRLSKREYFAAMAMQAIITKENSAYSHTAESAVQYADALLEVLNGK